MRIAEVLELSTGAPPGVEPEPFPTSAVTLLARSNLGSMLAERPRARGVLVGVPLLLAGSLSGVAGFVVRAARVPERWVPRRREFSVFCDIVGASHQWWHVLTMVGPLLAQQGNARLLAFRYAEGSVCPAY